LQIVTPQRAALYLRVSTDRQSTENQKPEVEQLARARGFEVVTIYEEQASAAKARPKYEQMLKDARRRKFDVLVVWALDRFGRSMTGNLTDVLELDRVGVTVVSVRESWLDTGSPVRSLLVAILSWVAEQERARLIERTKAGLEAARRRGAKIGRPRRRIDVGRARELRAGREPTTSICQGHDVAADRQRAWGGRRHALPRAGPGFERLVVGGVARHVGQDRRRAS
jgi:DNA invertase Pin-like site-specific DNA recombinase